MERMTPIDLERAELRTRFRGYDKAQVEELRGKAAAEMASLLREAKTLKDENDLLRAEVEGFRRQEGTLKEALILAQRTAEETIALAHKEADRIVQDARRVAEQTARQDGDRLNDLRWDLERVRLEKQKYINDYRAMLESQLRHLSDLVGREFSVVEGDPPQAAGA